ncbi:MAG: hypothetical protein HN350_19930 [Phycisphaerales bacterium]|nr:hypothetical protein [Phycisphaerales bacterium]
MNSGHESSGTSETRRDFIKKTATAAVAISSVGFLPPTAYGQDSPAKVALVTDRADKLLKQPPVQWAIGRMQDRLKAKNISVALHAELKNVSPDVTTVIIAGHASTLAKPILKTAGVSIPDVPEAVGLVRGKSAGRSVLLASGSDVRGLVYAVLELADRVEHAPNPVGELQRPDRIVEQPANPIRSIARMFTSELEDKAWYYDKSFWEKYLSMLMTQRINRFTMTFGLGYNAPRRIRDSYFYFTYPFLLSVPGYKVKAVGLSDKERDRNMEMLRFIVDQTTRRGLHFQLALWTHAYNFRDSPDVNYRIEGLTPQNHAAYCRDALHMLLNSCPKIDGVTFRCHSESGVPQGSYEFWKTVFDGVVRVGKKRPIDLHSKGIDFKLIDTALATGMPVTVSPKYWAEHQGLPYHQAAIQAREWQKAKPGENMERQRRFTRYGYADYLRADRRFGVLYRIWPGTQRLLLWGDPAMAAGYSRYSNICGSLGVELCEPLSFKGRMGSGLRGSRDGYADASLRPKGGDWTKYLYTYRIWGRMMYNPNTPREVWSRFLKTKFGRAAGDCEIALSRASRVLLLITTAHTPSCSNNGYWPEIHMNIPIVAGNRFCRISPLDPALFITADEFADELISGKRSGKYSPMQVARWLDNLAKAANAHLIRARAKVADAKDPAFRRLSIDTEIQAGTATYFAEKLRAAAAYAFYRKTGDRAAVAQALKRYKASRDAWAKLSETATGVYVPDITFGPNSVLRGHWADRLKAIDKDLADMDKQSKEKPPAAESEKASVSWSRAISRPGFGRNAQSRVRCQHLPPAAFRPGKPIPIEIAAEPGCRLSSAVLHYRHVDQSAAYQTVEMSVRGGRWRADIPAKYTDSPYPLLYYVELHDPRGAVWLYPGLNANLANQPYFVIRRA